MAGGLIVVVLLVLPSLGCMMGERPIERVEILVSFGFVRFRILLLGWMLTTVDCAGISGRRLALLLVCRSRGCRVSAVQGMVVCICPVVARATRLGRL
jgi:hypothetical protein